MYTCIALTFSWVDYLDSREIIARKFVKYENRNRIQSKSLPSNFNFKSTFFFSYKCVNLFFNFWNLSTLELSNIFKYAQSNQLIGVS